MKKIIGISLGLAIAVLIASPIPSYAAAHLTMAVKKAMVSGSEIFTDGKGMTLYTFDKDTSGVSNCSGKCAVNWPPMMAKTGAKAEGSFSIIKRADGTMQWAHKGLPLYTWIKDTKAGDTTGDGVGKVWHTARP